MSNRNDERRRSAARLYDEASVAIKRQNWREAITKLDLVVDIAPDLLGATDRHGIAHEWHRADRVYALGCHCMADRRWREALTYFRRVEGRVGSYKDSAARIRICVRELSDESAALERAAAFTPDPKSLTASSLAVASMAVACTLIWSAATVRVPVEELPRIVMNVSATPTPTLFEETATISPEIGASTPEPDTGVDEQDSSETPDPQATTDGESPQAPSQPGSAPTRRSTTPVRRLPTSTPRPVTPPIVTRVAIAATSTPTRAATATRAPTATALSQPTATQEPTLAAVTPSVTPSAAPAPATPSATPAPATPTATGGAVIVGFTVTPPSATPTSSLLPTRTPTAAASPTPAPVAVSVRAVEYQFSPASLTLAAGARVRITLTNSGNMDHAWSLVDSAGRSIVRVVAPAGQSVTRDFIAPAAGNYSYICDIADHAQLGMSGTAFVR